MMKPLKLKTLDQRELPKIANHLFFGTALLFAAHQVIVQPAPSHNEASMMVQALHLQPRTPPPLYDIDQLSGNETDPTPSWEVRRPLLVEPSGFGVTPLTLTEAGTDTERLAPSSTDPVQMRSDAPDREARALPPRERSPR